jgi:hypothetical protein
MKRWAYSVLTIGSLVFLVGLGSCISFYTHPHPQIGADDGADGRLETKLQYSLISTLAGGAILAVGIYLWPRIIMEDFELFRQAVQDCKDLPADVRTHVADARSVEKSRFDESYIEFLDEQIRLSPRGPQWTEVLRRRRDTLRSFCRVSLLSGHIRVGQVDTWVKVDPKRRMVVFWEQLS